MNSLLRYYLDLGFYSDEVEMGVSLQHRRMLWSLSAYCLLLLGVLARQLTNLTVQPIDIAPPDSKSVVLASAIVALALFAPFMHFITRKWKRPSWRHVLWAFSFGFFVDFSGHFVLSRLFRL